MSFLAPKPPIQYVSPEYMPELNRVPPGTGTNRLTGCLWLLVLVGGLLVIAAIVWAVFFRGLRNETTTESLASPTPPESALQAPPPTSAPTDLPTTTPTLDPWSLTGTAIALITATATPTPSPTMDYCWYLTPSATPSATPVPVTPDAWAATGTAVYLATGTPTNTPTATQPPPRAWCDLAAAQPAQPETTVEWDGTPARTFDPSLLPPPLPSYTPYPTYTPAPPRIEREEIIVRMTAPPEVDTVIVRITAPPRVIVQTEPPRIITATLLPTQTRTPSPTASVTSAIIASATFTPTTSIPTETFPPASATATLTETPIMVITLTSTETPTDVPTAAPTETPTDVPTAAPTETPTDVPTATPTDVPTDVPTIPPTATATPVPLLAIYNSYCQSGLASWQILNTGGALLESLRWQVSDPALVVLTSGYLTPELLFTYGVEYIDVLVPPGAWTLDVLSADGHILLSSTVECV